MEQMGENSFLFLQMAEFTQEKKKYLNASKNPVLGAFTDKKKSQIFTLENIAFHCLLSCPLRRDGCTARFPGLV